MKNQDFDLVNYINEIQKSNYAYSILEDIYIILLNKKNVCLIQTPHMMDKESLMLGFTPISAIQILWNDCYYYIIVTKDKIQSNWTLSELIHLVIKIENIEKMYNDVNILKNTTIIYYSSESAFSATEDSLCKGLVSQIPLTWEPSGAEGFEWVLDKNIIITTQELESIIRYFMPNNITIQQQPTFMRVFAESNTLDIKHLYTLLKDKKIYIVSSEGNRKVRSCAYNITQIDDIYTALTGGQELESGYTTSSTILYIDCYPL